MANDKRIAFKIVVDDKGAIIGLKSTTKGFQDVDLSSKNAKASVDKLNNTLKQVGSGRTVTNIKLTKKELQGLRTSLGATSMASGSADASILELGRTISDSNYGIRGMANNLSQLTSNLTYTIKKAGGLAAGFRALWSSIAGPLGLLLAIQGLLALWERYDMKQDEVKRSTEEATDELKQQIVVLTAYEEQLSNSNLTLEERVEVLKGLSKLDKELSKQLKSANGDTEKQKIILSEYIGQLKNEKLIKEQKLKIDKFLAEEEQKAVDLKSKYNKLIGQSIQMGGGEVVINNLKKGLDKELNALQEEKNRLLSIYIDLLNQQKNNDPDEKPIKIDTIAYYESLIKPLEEQQKEVATTSEEYRVLQKEIDKYLNKIYQIKREARGDVGGAVNSLVPKGLSLGSIEDDPEVAWEKEKADQKIKIGQMLSNEMSKIRGEEAAAIMIEESFKREQMATTFSYAQSLFGMAQGLLEDNKALKAAFIIAEKGAAIGEMIIDYNVAKLANTAHAATLGPILGAKYLAGSNALAKIQLIGGIAGAGLGAATALKALGKGGAGGDANIGGESSGRTFDFNLVGSTGVNQLAQTVGGQVSQPIKAYVVGSEITNQQAFDNQIQGQATIG